MFGPVFFSKISLHASGAVLSTTSVLSADVGSLTAALPPFTMTIFME